MENPIKIIVAFQTEVGKLLANKPNNASLYLCEDVQWHLPDSLNNYITHTHPKGIAQVLDLIQNTTNQCYKIHTMHFEFHGVICDKNKVHQHFTLSAETINGKNYRSGYQALFRLENQKIAEVWEYFDSGLLLSLVSD